MALGFEHESTGKTQTQSIDTTLTGSEAAMQTAVVTAGEEKLKAYPVCTMDGGVARKVENGSEEVAEVELSISVMPDEYGQGMYEALKEDLSVGTTANDWMTKFTPAMVQTVAA